VQNFKSRQFYLEIDFLHLHGYNEALHDRIISEPTKFLPVVRSRRLSCADWPLFAPVPTFRALPPVLFSPHAAV
jgi:hypothetical protein